MRRRSWIIEIFIWSSTLLGVAHMWHSWILHFEGSGITQIIKILMREYSCRLWVSKISRSLFDNTSTTIRKELIVELWNLSGGWVSDSIRPSWLWQIILRWALRRLEIITYPLVFCFKIYLSEVLKLTILQVLSSFSKCTYLLMMSLQNFNIFSCLPIICSFQLVTWVASLWIVIIRIVIQRASSRWLSSCSECRFSTTTKDLVYN